MTMWLKQSTAVTVLIGPFVDETDGKTAETGLTVSQADVRLSKNGGDMAQKGDATSCTHDEIGYYTCPLSTTDTGTLGVLRLMVHESGALPVWADYMVVPANVWDSLFGADALQVHAVEIAAGLITAAAIATDAIDADAIADNAINAAAIATGAITAAKFAAGAIDAAAIATGAITAAKFAAGAIDAAAIATDAIDADALATDALTEIGVVVNAQVLDVLVTDTFAEPASVPAATSSIKDKINWIFMLSRNKRVTTSAADKVRNDGDSADIGTATLSDDGSTHTSGKFS